jgi:hypothetical protein
MSKSYRIRTELGINKQIVVDLQQDYDFLEILSLKFRPEEIYPRSCADYGVITGRVFANGGYGVPNAKVSIFIPLSDIDSQNPVISTLYPYRNLNDVNEDGYRYNLLPYTSQHSGHVGTGTFPSMNDVLVDNTVVEIYDKYYKFTVKTNSSGDYMIFGVPLGNQTVFLDLDLSDMGQFSLNPQDLIRMGRATESQLDGNKFKASENLDSLPQIVSQSVDVSIDPFWGQEEICQSKIHRLDFDLRKLGIEIQPTAIFMGSLISNSEKSKISKNCKPALEGGNLCDLVTGPGEILSIRQTIFVDSDNRPILEEFKLENGGKVIEEDGTWLVDVPMNLDYVVTNEFGDLIISPNPSIGIPTSGKYRFKIKWRQSDTLTEAIKRGYYLVPNIRETWDDGSAAAFIQNSLDPTNIPLPDSDLIKSYAFSLDWEDYGNTGTTVGNQMINNAINCVDKFYIFKYNKVYTVSQLIDQYHNGKNRARFIGIKEITDNRCETENNKFPITDGVRNFNINYFILSFFLYIITALILVLLPVTHILAILVRFFALVFNNLIIPICRAVNRIPFVTINCPQPIQIGNLLTLALPLITYPDCDLCEGCKQDQTNTDEWIEQFGSTVTTSNSTSALANFLNGDNLLNPCGLENYHIDAYSAVVSGNKDLNKYWKRTPFWFSFIGNEIDLPGTFGGSTPIYENINRFNLKDKYFNNQIDGQNNWSGGNLYTWGGLNKIKVYIEPNKTQNFGKYHNDNVFILLVDPERLSEFNSGKIVTFQDPQISQDPNVDNLIYNYLPGERNITVSYANPFEPQGAALVENYVIDLTGTSQSYLYPTDLEYFQVLTGMTVNNFESLRNPNGSTDFWDEFLNRENTASYTQRKPNVASTSQVSCFSLAAGNPDCFYSPLQRENPLAIFTELCQGVGTFELPVNTGCQNIVLRHFEEYGEMGIIIMVRGVDINTERINIDYGLGRIFGYGNEDDIIIRGQFKLNIPIQPKLNLPRHDEINFNIQSSNGGVIFNKTFYTDWSQNFTSYVTSAHTYYSALDSSRIDNFIVDDNRPNYTRLTLNTIKDFTITPNYVVELNRTYVQTLSDSNVILRSGTNANYGFDWNFAPAEDYIEGGSFIYKSPISYFVWVGVRSQLWPVQTCQTTPLGAAAINNCDNIQYSYNGSNNGSGINTPYFPVYFAPSYNRDGTTVLQVLGSFIPGTENFLVFRCDRLPTSTTDDKNLNNYFAGQANIKLSLFFFDDDGNNTSIIGTEEIVGQSVGEFDSQNGFGSDINNTLVNRFSETFSCDGMVDLGCYGDVISNGEIINIPNPNSDCNKLGGNQLVKNGCYFLIKRAILDLNPLLPNNDFAQVAEWANRIRVNLAACLNIFSHTFVNSWINGTLYAFNIKNNRFFDSQNRPYSLYCHDVAILNPLTNEYFYRSSPYLYSSNTFIGQNSPSDGVQDKQLLFPTTIMDLGPLNSYTNELILGPEYAGYIMDKIPSTTYQDITDIFLLFIVSRQLNQNFIQQAFSLGQNGGANGYFNNSRGDGKKRIDGDYIQNIQINSQFGVFEYSFDQYDDTDFYISNSNELPTVGMFFKSDRELRDLITPRRLIFSESVTLPILPPTQDIPLFTQEIPHYKWSTTGPTIFGTENNDWSTNLLTKGLYQKQDRLTSNYFIGSNTIVSAITGYITQTNSDGTNNPTLTTTTNGVVQVGSPWYFYFGLKKGSSAVDKFFIKYLV